MFDLIHGINEVTLAKPVGHPWPQSNKNDKTPTRIFFPFFFTTNGPPSEKYFIVTHNHLDGV